MQTNKTKTKLYLDIALTLAYIALMFPAFTGLSIHEWLGLAIGGAVIFHLAINWRWIVNVTRRFFGKLARQARINYLVNLALLVSFTLTMVSGLIISVLLNSRTLLGLSAEAMRFWQNVHAVSPKMTLVILAIHLVLHRKWIVNACKRYLFNRRRQPVPTTAAAYPQAAAQSRTPLTRAEHNTLNRRKFLKLAGCGAAVAVIGGKLLLVDGAGNVVEAATCPYAMINDPYPGACKRYVDKNGNGICDLSEVAGDTTENTPPADTTLPDNTVDAAPAAGETTADAVQSSTLPTTDSSGAVICNHGCSYPGQCGRYLDTNGTGRCDLSEFTAAQAQAAGGELALAASMSAGRGRHGH
jgi:hypothetical protein